MKKNTKLSVLVLSFSLILFSGFTDFTGIFEKTVIIDKKHLPEKIQTFIDEHFSNYDFFRAVEDYSYSVMFKGSTQIEFSREGNWTYVSGHGSIIPTTFIDTKILNAVETKFGKDKIIAISRTKKYYDVTLKDDTKLKIDIEGNIVKEKIKK